MKTYRLGILDTDSLPEELEKTYGHYSKMFERLLSSQTNTIDYQRYHVCAGQWPYNIDDCDGYLITGSKVSAYDSDNWIAKLKDFIGQAFQQHIKMIGICFGHQIIAEALGGKVEKCNRGWGVGVCQYQMQDQQIALLASHQDQVTHLPLGARIIARNDFCPIAGFTLANHIWTLQPHPEFVPNYCKELILKRRELIGHERADKALASLNTPTDELQVTRAMLNFLRPFQKL